ncbi:hypothetical protein OS493_026807 [Desmophyllum pertusum]|uniref:Uncharacterized protein n=1 Tax=Desmophyllum pertusum TaxID=174260 RepID=A0A9X0D1X0_9CNID|nr:hypothetical protein OS493_026807 [Desmophyllum pertusum]
MNAELGFLVFVLYCYLFLDLYSSFVNMLCAKEGDHAKKPWQFKTHLLEQKEVGRKNLATRPCTNFKKDERHILHIDLPEMSFYREMMQPRRHHERMVSVQKSRLWGRG